MSGEGDGPVGAMLNSQCLLLLPVGEITLGPSTHTQIFWCHRDPSSKDCRVDLGRGGRQELLQLCRETTPGLGMGSGIVTRVQPREPEQRYM